MRITATFSTCCPRMHCIRETRSYRTKNFLYRDGINLLCNWIKNFKPIREISDDIKKKFQQFLAVYKFMCNILSI